MNDVGARTPGYLTMLERVQTATGPPSLLPGGRRAQADSWPLRKGNGMWLMRPTAVLEAAAAWARRGPLGPVIKSSACSRACPRSWSTAVAALAHATAGTWASSNMGAPTLLPGWRRAPTGRRSRCKGEGSTRAMTPALLLPPWVHSKRSPVDVATVSLASAVEARA